MKLLMIYATSFGYNPTIKSIESMPDFNEAKSFDNVQVAFIQVEKEDEENRVWYVGVTRTSQNLYIMTAKKEARGYDIESLG